MHLNPQISVKIHPYVQLEKHQKSLFSKESIIDLLSISKNFSFETFNQVICLKAANV